MRFAKMISISAFSLICCACVPSINMKEAQIHYQAALNFDVQGDYVSAREQYWKSLVAARSAGAEPEVISMLSYEFGRVTGYTCHLDESEKYLLEALQMEENLPHRNGRNITIRLFELARLTYDQKRYKDAASYYSKALQEAERNGSIKLNPIAFANAYEECAVALSQCGDSGSAQEALQKAQGLRAAYPGRTAKFKPVRYKCTTHPALQMPPFRGLSTYG